jgi:hypothetical protein
LKYKVDQSSVTTSKIKHPLSVLGQNFDEFKFSRTSSCDAVDTLDVLGDLAFVLPRLSHYRMVAQLDFA